eukprot:COSAG01_NODE_56348_length_319_cov_0.631818_1_plen_29_part_01
MARGREGKGAAMPTYNNDSADSCEISLGI